MGRCLLVTPFFVSLVLAAGAASGSQAVGERVPIVVDKGVLFVKALIGESRPMLFVFDPGADSYFTEYGARQSAGSPMLRLGSISIAAPLHVLEGDPSQLDPAHDQSLGQIAGTIGAELMHRFVLRIDYARRELTLMDPSNFNAPDAKRLPLSVDSFGVPTIPATVNDVPGTFELDVRAPSSMLFTPFARSLGFRVPQTAKRRVDSIVIGGYRQKDVAVWISSADGGKFAAREPLGLLGNDVLAAYVITIDYSRATVYVSPGAH